MSEKTVEEMLSPLIERGFALRNFYEKGGDSSCVYIQRFQKGKDFFDWREVSGGEEINFVVFVDGEYAFPNPKYRYKKELWKFKLRHLLKKPSFDEKRVFYATLILSELNKPDFFGIK